MEFLKKLRNKTGGKNVYGLWFESDSFDKGYFSSE